MPYIGNQPSESFTSFATQEFSTSATTSYTLNHAVTNENEIALFINNVRQQPGSGKAYTATGTALTLSAATASTDTMYCVFLGRALQTVNPAGGSVGSSQISADIITGLTALTSKPADTDEFLISDAGTLKRIDASLVGSVSMASGFANTDVNQTIQSNTLTDLNNVTASITPSSTSSKVLIVGRVQSHSSGYGIGLGIVRGSTVIYEDEATSATYSGDSEYVVSPFSFIDSPNTTSSTTYKVQVKTYSSASHNMQQGGDSNICLVEILG